MKTVHTLLTTLACTLLGCSALFATPDTKEHFATELSLDSAAKINFPITQEDVDRISKTFGHLIGNNLDTPGIKLNIEKIVEGIRSGAAGEKAPMTETEYQDYISAIEEHAFDAEAQTNLEIANAFLEDNAKNNEVVEIETGKLQYQVLQKGEGDEVVAHSAPKLSYKGMYADGTTFGTSETVGGSIAVPLDQTIPGLNRAVVGMKVGEKRKIYIHPEMAYGTSGTMPPNSLLVFEVEVLETSPAPVAETYHDVAETEILDSEEEV